MATAPKFRRKNSCPDGWLNAGAKVPIHLTVRQENYCRGCHRHPPVLLQPGRPDSPVLPPQPPLLAQLDGHQQGLQRRQAGGLSLRDPGSSGGCHRRLPGLRSGRGQLAQPRAAGPGPKNQAPFIHRRRLLPGGRQRQGDPVRRKAQGETPLPGQRQAGLHPAQGHLLRGQHPEGERPVVHLPEALETAGAEAGAVPPGPAASTPGSTPSAPTPMVRPTGIPKPPTKCRKTSGGGSGPRPGGRRDPWAGGKPSVRSTSATGASGA